MKSLIFLGGLAAVVFATPLRASAPFLDLGPASGTGFSQPMVDVELFDSLGASIGPSTTNNFLLDTGANGIVFANTATAEIRGFRSEGQILEQGVGGFIEFDVSAAYGLEYRGTDGAVLEINDARVMSSADTNFCQLGICPFHGVMGMPAMMDRLVQVDLGSEFSTTFPSEIPPAGGQRFSVPLTSVVKFEPHGDGPFPSWANIPFISVDPKQGDNRQTGNFVFDTGAQLSLISSKLAFDLGLDRNNNGTLADEQESSVQVSGVGGIIDVPQLTVDEFRVPTREGVDLVYNDVLVGVLDITPTIDGIFGMNMLAAGELDLGGLDLGLLGGLLGGGGDLDGLLELLQDLGLSLDDVGLGGLGGLLGNGDGGQYFDAAYLDFRGMSTTDVASLVLDLSADMPGVTIGVGGVGDLNNDGLYNFADRELWVEENNTFFGDSNEDGEFNSTDLVFVFQAGQYEDGVYKNSNWASGDWNGDGEFNTSDLVLAFQGDSFEKGPRAASTVPEPSVLLLIIGATISLPLMRRRLG